MSLNISKQQVFFLGIAYRYRRKSLSTIIWEFYGCGKLAFCKTARKLQENIVAFLPWGGEGGVLFKLFPYLETVWMLTT